MDYCLPNSYLGQLLSHIVGRVLYRYVTRKSQFFDFFLTIRVLGQLFLGYFSGPVEGIIMIVIIFTITGFYGLKLTRFFLYLLTLFISFTGPSFWDQDLWKITHLDHIPFLPNLRLNESFMVLAGALLAFNIIHRFFYFFQALHIVLNTKKNLLIPKQLS